MLKRIAFIVLIVAAALYAWREHAAPPARPVPELASSEPRGAAESRSSQQVEDAFRSQRSGLMVSATGTVDRILRDDTDGSRHQRFIMRVVSGQTLLIAHNIDLAPRVPGLAAGEPITLHGEYEWNDQGGVIHWTHRDPAGSHEPGWIEYAGRRYD